jgi:hypothetical protein
MGGTLRYKPSAADLQDHPGKHDVGESAPLLTEDEESDYGQVLRMPRQRSGTTGSGGTSDSYRSRGDLFPSDGEGEEDAVPLDDDVTYDMVRRDDKSSGKTRSSKGKTPEGEFAASRTLSRSTLGSTASNDTPNYEGAQTPTTGMANVPSMEDLHAEEVRLQQEEDDAVARKKAAALQLASERGLSRQGVVHGLEEAKMPELEVDKIRELQSVNLSKPSPNGQITSTTTTEPTNQPEQSEASVHEMRSRTTPAFHAARLPHFG